MNTKMITHSQLSIESKKTNQANNQNRNRITEMEISREEEVGRMGERYRE